ncbi:hypothetical protein [Streptomyces rishiriensis]|nr:hypothetical protein [Streptomyces rishiriensis]
MAPQDDGHGRPIHLELCPACDVVSCRRVQVVAYAQ